MCVSESCMGITGCTALRREGTGSQRGRERNGLHLLGGHCLVFRCCLVWLASSSDLSAACRSLFVVSLFVCAFVFCLVVTCGMAGELAR